MASATLDRVDAERDGSRAGLPARAGDWLQATILGLAGLVPSVAYIVVTRSVTAPSAVLLVAGLATAGLLAVAVARRDVARAFWIGAGSMGLAPAGVITLSGTCPGTRRDTAPSMTRMDAVISRGESRARPF